MPRKTKDEEVKKVTKRSKKADLIEVGEKSTSIKNAQKAPKLSTSKTEKKSKNSTAKASSSKSMAKKSTTSKKDTTKASSKKTTTRKTTTKNSTPQNKVATKKTATTPKETASKKSTPKKTTSKRTSTKTTTTTTTTKRTTNRKSKLVATTEYYDLPTAYNRTIVKILAQTPSSLFVYWEISKDDKIKLQEQYGEAFFQNTKPYLIITNETMNYSFEIEINDYANSWYIHIYDSSCKYGVQLIRKPIQHDISSSNSIINIISSNEIATPNDHILFDKLGKTVFFRDVKSHREVEKDISSLSFISNIGRVYNIYDIYKEIYKNELNGDELGMGLSSSGFSSTFK